MQKIFNQVKNEVARRNVVWVAETAGVAPATLYFWLTGRTKRPRLDTVCKVAAACGLRLEVARCRKLRKAA